MLEGSSFNTFRIESVHTPELTMLCGLFVMNKSINDELLPVILVGLFII